MDTLSAGFRSEYDNWVMFDKTSGSDASFSGESKYWTLTVSNPVARQCFLLRANWGDNGQVWWRLFYISSDGERLCMYVPDPTDDFNMRFCNASGCLYFADGLELQPGTIGYCNAITKNLTWDEYFDWFTGWLTGFAGSLSGMSRQKQALLVNAVSHRTRESAAQVVAELAEQVAAPVFSLLDKSDSGNPLPGMVKKPGTRLEGNIIINKLLEMMHVLRGVNPKIKLPTKCLEVRS